VGVERRAAEHVQYDQSEIHDEPDLNHTRSRMTAESGIRCFGLCNWGDLIDEV
jgi:hypothetical protein